MAEDIVDAAERAWDKFVSAFAQQEHIFRISPKYPGAGFKLDDSRKLDDIERAVERWIGTQNAKLSNICDRLIAALFFCHRLLSSEQAGEILCRLPSDGRDKLVHGILGQQTPVQFMVEYDATNDKKCTSVTGQLEAFITSATTELCLRVELPAPLPTSGQIHVQMRSLLGGQLGWLPISGSPYTIVDGDFFGTGPDV